jgi:hypothetical protein
MRNDEEEIQCSGVQLCYPIPWGYKYKGVALCETVNQITASADLGSWSTNEWQTHHIVREGALQQKDSKCPTAILVVDTI